jgi:micrococcal nuclease
VHHQLELLARLIPVTLAALTLGAAAVLSAACGDDDAASPRRTAQAGRLDPTTEKVLKVQSGETFISGTGSTRSLTRIIGIDAPESNQCGFEHAARHLRSLIEGKRVALPTDSLQPKRDRAGRRLRYAVLGGGPTTALDVGYRAVASGWARVSLQHDFILVAEYLEAQDKAQRERRGLWRCDRGTQ